MSWARSASNTSRACADGPPPCVSQDNKSAGVGLYNSSAAFFGAVLLAGACIVLTQEASARSL